MAQSLRARSPRTNAPRAPPVASHQPRLTVLVGRGFFFLGRCVLQWPASQPRISYTK